MRIFKSYAGCQVSICMMYFDFVKNKQCRQYEFWIHTNLFFYLRIFGLLYDCKFNI